MATAYPLARMVESIGGEMVDVDWIAEAGENLRGYVPDESTIGRFRTADLVVANGSIETWAVEGSGGTFGSHRIIRLDGLAERRVKSGALLWFDPQVADVFIAAVADNLKTQRPVATPMIDARAKHLEREIRETAERLRSRLGPVRGVSVAIVSEDFVRLLEWAGMQPMLVADGGASLSDPLLDWLALMRREGKLQMIVVSIDRSPAYARHLEERTGLVVARLDAYGSSAGDGRNSLVKLMHFNVQQLLDAAAKLGGTPTR